MIPWVKVTSLIQKLLHVKSSKTVRVKTLKSLTGSLNFYSQAKPGGCPFICHLYDGEKYYNPKHHVNITSEMKKDISVWLKFLEPQATGAPFLDILEVPGSDIQFFMDASGDPALGWGVYFAGAWTQGRWPLGFIDDHDLPTGWLELYALVVGVLTWEHLLSGR